MRDGGPCGCLCLALVSSLLLRGMWCLLWRWSATTTALPSRGLGQGALNAGELPGQSSLLGAARGGWNRRRLGGDTDSIQTAVKR